MKNHYMMWVRVLLEPSNMCRWILWCVVLQNKSRILFEEEGGIFYAAQISSKNPPLYFFMWSEVCEVSVTPADTSPYVRRRQSMEGLKG